MYALVLSTFCEHLEHCILLLTTSNLRTKPALFQPKLKTTELNETSPCSNYLFKLWMPWHYLMTIQRKFLTVGLSQFNLWLPFLLKSSSTVSIQITLRFLYPLPLIQISGPQLHWSEIHYFSTGYFTTPQLSNSELFTFKKNVISKELLYSYCLFFTFHSHPTLF